MVFAISRTLSCFTIMSMWVSAPPYPTSIEILAIYPPLRNWPLWEARQVGSGISVFLRHAGFRSCQTNKHEQPSTGPVPCTLIAEALGDKGIEAEDWSSEEERSVAQIGNNVPGLRDAYRTFSSRQHPSVAGSESEVPLCRRFTRELCSPGQDCETLDV